jgi:hypothetical protein
MSVRFSANKLIDEGKRIFGDASGRSATWLGFTSSDRVAFVDRRRASINAKAEATARAQDDTRSGTNTNVQGWVSIHIFRDVYLASDPLYTVARGLINNISL